MELLDYNNSTQGKIDLRDGSSDFMREIKKLRVVGDCAACKSFAMEGEADETQLSCTNEEGRNYAQDECPPDDDCKFWEPKA